MLYFLYLYIHTLQFELHLFYLSRLFLQFAVFALWNSLKLAHLVIQVLYAPE